MSIEGVKRARRGGFTLLEITLAVAILAMMAMAIYRFVAANIAAMQMSSQQTARRVIWVSSTFLPPNGSSCRVAWGH